MTDSEEGAPARRGPRGSRGVVRARILDSARTVFAASGFKGTTTQEVAAAAGVDPRTVAYYFADREQLLEAALEPPAEFLAGVGRLNSVPLERRGRAFVEALLHTWSRPANRDLLALIIAIGEQYPAGLAGLDDVYRNRFVGYIASGLADEQAQLRAGLVAGEIVSVSVARFVWRLRPLSTLSDDAVVSLVGPTLQRYLDGDLGLAGDVLSAAGSEVHA